MIPFVPLEKGHKVSQIREAKRAASQMSLWAIIHRKGVRVPSLFYDDDLIVIEHIDFHC
jgi:hypothetical protein